MSDFTIVRQSLIEWFSTSESDNVLIVGEPEGFMASLFDGRAALVQSVNDVSMLSSCADKNDKYDLILMYDLYSFCITSNTLVCDMIRSLKSLLTQDGVLFLAMENKLGLKYFAGCQEEQNGDYFTGIEDYVGLSDIRPLSKRELTDTLETISDISYKFYYPYPDYKYPTMIFSDDCLPTAGELNRNLRNIDRDRYILFDECKVYDSLIKAGLFPEFSNSYLIKITSSDCSSASDNLAHTKYLGELIYTKYSTDRCLDFAIRTDRIKDDDGSELIVKHALYKEGRKHLQHMVNMYKALSQRYGDKMTITGSHIDDGRLYNDFAKGVPLTDTFIKLIKNEDSDALKAEIKRFIDIISYGANEPFTVTDEFINVFGKHDNIESFNFSSAKVNDIDMIFDNIIVDDDGTWQLIDYEWTFDFPIPLQFIVYRALFFFYQRYQVEATLPWNDILDMINVNDDCEQLLFAMESKLNDYITLGITPLERAVIDSDNAVIPFKDLRDRFDYFDIGKQFEKDAMRLNIENNAYIAANKHISGQLEAKRQELNSYKKTADKTSIEFNKLKDQFVMDQNELNSYRNSFTARLKRKLK